MTDLSDVTALITGASSGIGAALSEELADRGVGRLVLVARRADRLEALASRLPGAVAHPADLTDPTAIADLIAAWPEVDLVVNNAGFGYRGPLATQDPERLLAMVDLNCRALLQLSQAWLPRMTARHRGWILNVGSIVGFLPVPTSAVYAASKAFVHSLTEALRAETMGTGVKVHLLAPGPVPTEFFERSRGQARGKPSPLAISPERLARQAIDDLLVGRPRRIPRSVVRLLAMAASGMPMPLLRPLMARIVAADLKNPT
ncbi:MAG: short-subunit dehydrogenase [Myxococcota bacterium]